MIAASAAGLLSVLAVKFALTTTNSVSNVGCLPLADVMAIGKNVL